MPQMKAWLESYKMWQNKNKNFWESHVNFFHLKTFGTFDASTSFFICGVIPKVPIILMCVWFSHQSNEKAGMGRLHLLKIFSIILWNKWRGPMFASATQSFDNGAFQNPFIGTRVPTKITTGFKSFPGVPIECRYWNNSRLKITSIERHQTSVLDLVQTSVLDLVQTSVLDLVQTSVLDQRWFWKTKKVRILRKKWNISLIRIFSKKWNFWENICNFIHQLSSKYFWL